MITGSYGSSILKITFSKKYLMLWENTHHGLCGGKKQDMKHNAIGFLYMMVTVGCYFFFTILCTFLLSTLNMYYFCKNSETSIFANKYWKVKKKSVSLKLG